MPRAVPGHGRCSVNVSRRSGFSSPSHLPYLISPLPPQPPGPIQLQPCQEELPSHPGRMLDAGPEVRLRPARPAWGPLRRPVTGHCQGSPLCFGDTAALKGTERKPRGAGGIGGGHAFGYSKAVLREQVGGGQRGFTCCSCVSFPFPGSLTWLWPGRLRRSRRFLLGKSQAGGAGRVLSALSLAWQSLPSPGSGWWRR